jgi:nucleotide-binding universal stress UspA family protein
MRVLLATDGSACAGVATELVASARWPSDTSVEVISCVDVPASLSSPFAPSTMDLGPLEDALRAQHGETLQASADRVRSRGLTATTCLTAGPPAAAIVQRCTEVGADLIVCGSRGQGQLKSMLLGSVSAGLCELAPCPVLVVRRPSVARVLLAHDGSDPALAAEQVVRTWPLFLEASALVLSVVRVHPAWQEAIAMLTVGAGLERYGEEVAGSRMRLKRANREAVLRLIAERRQAFGTVEEGDPSAMIVAVAEEMDADLIVLGTHGRSGVERLLLGSVARAVLLHTRASVLVARPAPVLTVEPVPSAAKAPALAGAA